MPETMTPIEVLEAAQAENHESGAEKSVDFSKCQMPEIVTALQEGRAVDYETFSPYLRDNDSANGSLKKQLNQSDRTGLEILKLLNREFSEGRAVSLYDEYNTPAEQTEPFSDEQRVQFLESIKQKLERERAKIDLFVSESERVEDAKELVQELEAKGLVKEKSNGAIYFKDGKGDGPDHFFPLRTKGGRWTCEALDASSFLKPENLEITHLVVLPKRFEGQQDRVFNILNALGIEPESYHNIFFDDQADPQEVVVTIEQEIQSAKASLQ